MRVVFVNRYFHPDFSATSQMLGDLAFALAREQFEVVVVTSRQIYDRAGAKLAPCERIDGVAVHRVASTSFGRAAAVGRLLDYLTFHVAAAVKLLCLLRAGDVIVAKTDPPLLSVTAGFAARLRGARLVNWLQDLFPEVLGAVAVDRAWVRRLLRILTLVRNRSLRVARCNVAIGQLMARHVRQLGVSGDTITVIENWCDGAVVAPVAHARNRLRRDWQLENSLVVGYSGNLGVAHEFETILSAAEQLRGRGDVTFLFVGAGSRLSSLQEQVAQRGLTNVTFKPYQSRDRLAESLSAADVHLVCLRPDMEGLVVPSKFYGVLAAGRPCVFIGDPQGELAAQVRALDCGYAVRGGDAAGLSKIIAELADDRSLPALLGTRARAAFERRFDRPVAVTRWAGLLRQVHQPR